MVPVGPYPQPRLPMKKERAPERITMKREGENVVACAQVSLGIPARPTNFK